jgi:hypothetical protein
MDDDSSGRFDPSLPLGTVAFRSWRSIKAPVMAWLWYLNVLYWIGFLHLGRDEAFWAVISYFAVGPLIALMVVTQRGLTRLSGLIHLPWVPFAIYLGLRLFTDRLGPPLSPADGLFYYAWLQVVFWSTCLCLLLDAVDVLRWIRGERYVLGSPEAASRGASRLAVHARAHSSTA